MKLNSNFCRAVKGLTASVALLAGFANAAPPTWLPPDGMPEGTVLLQIEELKAAYLQCDQLSSRTFLDSSTAAHCSVAAERLRRMGFDGRSEAVLDWWKAISNQNRIPTSVSRSATPGGLASL
jgi:hypothetical protein